jgi:multicomponent Na+:H+ antiporter subunit C
MSGSTIFGLLGAALIGLGLAGLILHRQPLRRVLAFSILGGGTFLLFGVVARRGAAAGVDADPVPQAMVITGIVVAFAALALAVTTMQRLEEEREAEADAASAQAAKRDTAG